MHRTLKIVGRLVVCHWKVFVLLEAKKVECCASCMKDFIVLFIKMMFKTRKLLLLFLVWLLCLHQIHLLLSIKYWYLLRAIICLTNFPTPKNQSSLRNNNNNIIESSRWHLKLLSVISSRYTLWHKWATGPIKLIRA